MNPLESTEDYLLTLFETCEILGKSSRTVTRYVHKHVLHPRGVKSRQGTLEYRFSKSEVEALKQKQNELGQFGYYEQEQMRRAPEVTFANYNYTPSIKEQTPYAIPGISFPTAQNQNFVISPSVAKSQPVNEEVLAVTEKEKIDEPVLLENIKKGEPVSSPVVDSPMAQIHNDDEIVTLLKETTEMLRDQLRVKDNQIKNLDDKIGQLIERNRETNILLKGLQDKMVLLEKPKSDRSSQMDRADHSQPAEAVKSAQSRNESGAQPPVPLPKENKNNEPVRVKVSSISEDPNSDTVANSMSRSREDKSDDSAKKGLFGKIFG